MSKRYHLLFALLLLIPFAVPAQDELLEPEKAFQYSATAVDANTLRVEWKIADGYYMYRERTSFSTDTPGVTLGEPRMPAGKLKDDPYFGKIEIYKHQLVVDVPITRTDPNVSQINLVSKSQGCNEPMGVCYPPLTNTGTVQLAAADTSDSGVAAISSLGAKLGLGGEQGNEILDPDEAFKLRAEVVDGNTVVARWHIAPGHYLYKDKFKVSVDSGDGVSVAAVNLPPGEVKSDPTFGDVEVFHDAAEARIQLARQNAAPQAIALKLTYQGCSEVAGICYPPQNKVVNFDLPAGSVSAAPVSTTPATTATEPGTQAAVAAPAPADETDVDRFVRLLSEGSIWTIIFTALGFGLLLAFTACMYPMIPIVSAIVVGQGEHATAMRGFVLTLIYVLGLAITFGVLGGIMAVVGGGVGLQAMFQSPWLLIPFATLFVILALAMFGFYNVQIPSALQSKLSTISNQQKGGTYLGVGTMGVLSALIIGPCGGPILIAALTYAATSGDVLRGFSALFMLGFGMGLPLLVVGAGGGTLLPKAGGWMDTVKATAGVVLIGVAILFLERMPKIFPPGMTMTLWSLLLIISAVYIGALEPLKEGISGWYRFWKGIGIVLLVWGVVVLLGGMTGGKKVFDPLHGSSLIGGATTTHSASMAGAAAVGSESHVEFKRIKTVADLQRELASAEQAGKTVMLDFYADWCTYCIQYEDYVFNVPAVTSELSKMVLLQADVTATDAEDKALMKHVNVFLPPAILFFGKNGQELSQFRLVGFLEADKFREHVIKVLQSG